MAGQSIVVGCLPTAGLHFFSAGVRNTNGEDRDHSSVLLPVVHLYGDELYAAYVHSGGGTWRGGHRIEIVRIETQLDVSARWGVDRNSEFDPSA